MQEIKIIQNLVLSCEKGKKYKDHLKVKSRPQHQNCFQKFKAEPQAIKIKDGEVENGKRQSMEGVDSEFKNYPIAKAKGIIADTIHKQAQAQETSAQML